MSSYEIDTHRIAYDVALKRPGCIMLQALLDCAPPNFQFLFPAETWLVDWTADMRVYPVTRAQLDRLSEITIQEAARRAAERRA